MIMMLVWATKITLQKWYKRYMIIAKCILY